MKPVKPFLTAVWSDVIIVSYAVSDATLTPYLPNGVELDRWEGQAYASLVAMDFKQTRLRNMAVPALPGLRDFPEINLRFYVRQGDRRGVIFVREFVPNPIVAGMARLTYNEPYAVAKMTSYAGPNALGQRCVRHDFTYTGDKYSVAVIAESQPAAPAAGDLTEFLKEQAWGFGRTKKGQLIRYRVQHPVWRTYPVESYEIGIDFAQLYGQRWHFLKGRAPSSVILAEGSPISLYAKEPAAPLISKAR